MNQYNNYIPMGIADRIEEATTPDPQIKLDAQLGELVEEIGLSEEQAAKVAKLQVTAFEAGVESTKVPFWRQTVRTLVKLVTGSGIVAGGLGLTGLGLAGGTYIGVNYATEKAPDIAYEVAEEEINRRHQELLKPRVDGLGTASKELIDELIKFGTVLTEQLSAEEAKKTADAAWGIVRGLWDDGMEYIAGADKNLDKSDAAVKKALKSSDLIQQWEVIKQKISNLKDAFVNLKGAMAQSAEFTDEDENRMKRKAAEKLMKNLKEDVKKAFESYTTPSQQPESPESPAPPSADEETR